LSFRTTASSYSGFASQEPGVESSNAAILVVAYGKVCLADALDGGSDRIQEYDPPLAQHGRSRAVTLTKVSSPLGV
jgi:S-formylglutathione hydrolase FrmB